MKICYQKVQILQHESFFLLLLSNDYAGILNVFITIYKLQLSSELSELIESMIPKNGGAARGSWR